MTHSLRHPQLSLEDTIAAKLTVLIEGVAHNKMNHDGPRNLAKEILADLREIIREEIEEAAKLPETVLDEKDLRIDVYTSGVNNWGLRVLHVPSAFVEQRHSEDWKSQLQAKADALQAMERRVRAWLDR